MRVLWILLALLVIAGGAALWNARHARTSGGGDHALLREALDSVAETAEDHAHSVSPTRSPGPRRDEPIEAIRAHAGGAGSSEAAVGVVQHVHAHPPSQHPNGAPAGGTAPPAPQGPTLTGAALAAELVQSAAERAGSGSQQAAPQSIAPRTLGPLPPLPPGVGERVELGLHATIPSATVAPGNIMALPDGTLRADDRFIIRGRGTAAEPYQITWDLLISASETYQPRQGLRAIPQRVALLNGAHVQIEGYAAFPAFSFDPSDMLMMLNRWDGCCIGVPPTPFDAIEVKLGAVPRENRRQVAYFGRLEGKLAVEPYLVDSWLVGLYLMSDGRFTLDL